MGVDILTPVRYQSRISVMFPPCYGFDANEVKELCWPKTEDCRPFGMYWVRYVDGCSMRERLEFRINSHRHFAEIMSS